VIRDLYSFSRNTVQPLEDIILERHPSWEKYVDDLKQITQKFQEKKEASNVLDFDDLLYGWLKLLNHSNIKTILQNQFKHVLVDEYQDTNKIQASIILALANTDTNIVAVGDDAQSIYSFRGADISNIISFLKTLQTAKHFA
jgi:DNA helicase-2/ATP-dependent DNA helicase PcrA